MRTIGAIYDTRASTSVKKQRDEQDERTRVERHDPLLGTVISARYRIVEKIAAGGFGAIYRAHDLAGQRDVAVKVLHTALAADPNVIARFRREGTTLSNLRSPHTVTTYELGETADGMLYIVMELLRGASLHERLRARGTLGWREALAIARAICDSLAEAHELGVIHRDLKPANIHLEPARADDGRGEPRYGAVEHVKVLDFGIAKIRRGAGLDDGGDLTNAGQMIGTIDYMAPEQILGAACDGRTDLFTLGILTYEMIAGRRPFEDSTTPTSMLAALLTQTPMPLSTWSPVPPVLDAVIARCLKRDPDERFATVHAFAAALDALLAAPADDGATRQIDLAPTMVGEPLGFDDEQTLFAPPPRRASPSSPPPEAHAHAPPPRRARPPTQPPPPPPPVAHTPPPAARTPPPAAHTPPLAARREPTPPSMPRREPTPPSMPRREPTPPPAPARREPTPPPAAAGAWHPYGTDPAADRLLPPYLPPVAPAFTPGRTAPPPAPIPPTPHPYDANRDAVVGRTVWILVVVIVAVLAVGLYTAIR